ncbi:MAG: molybdopterin oxidoreductase [Bdellovibrionaceae bacterium]|nr:molybdopterin oxidoreductase [Pseudobdellovibrionaceae bacterium]MBX3033496.1 molybdopterin oxidoreductase [Pseudobdellovibrionaceae bacterium]
MASHQHTDLHVSKFKAPQSLKTAAFALLAIGLITFVVGLMRNQERIWASYLTSFFFFSCLALGGLFFAAINNLTKAGWSVTIRRYSEAMTSFIPVILIGGLVLVAGMKHLYPWADPDVVASNPVVAAKTAYLNVGFFVLRLVLFTAGWFIFKWFIVGNSVKQDTDGFESHTLKNVGLSIGFVAFFALTFSLFSVDLLMSLLPTWYSTIFGIYCFAGLFQSTLAVLALIIIFMRRTGFVRGYVTVEHLHDTVKYLKGFTVFWAYIAFSQFMLIWYANIPEETEYYIMRSLHGWLGVSFALLIFRFIVPFIALLPRGAKRNENHVIAVSVLVLVMQYVDIWWMVYPNFFGGEMTFGFWEIGMFALFAGLFLICLMSFFTKFSLVAVKDPRIQEAINHHVTY